MPNFLDSGFSFDSTKEFFEVTTRNEFKMPSKHVKRI
jgi:hypothetical protein